MDFSTKPLELSPEFQYTLNKLEHTNNNFFITGKAGTGKSTLLSLFRNTSSKRIVVLAPTGIAALQIKGQTIHSFFGFPPKIITKEQIFRRRNQKLYQNMDTMIIDEISMVRTDLLDAISYFLKLHRNNKSPFGGVQMVFLGDLYQLPPIISTKEEYTFLSEHYDSPYFFSARSFWNSDFETITLSKIYRQEEKRFIRLLDKIRTLDMDYDDLEEINERVVDIPDSMQGYITISPRNQVVDKINNERLKEIDGPLINYTALITGNFSPNLYPTQAILGLKRGAQVMFIKNDPEKRFVNGSIGMVVELDERSIHVVLERENGAKEVINVPKLDWELIRYEYDTEAKKLESSPIGTFQQYPLKLAWAITIHKSQGQTFEKVIIELGKGAFEFGQTYVALSRCKTLDGIVLKRPLKPSDIKVDPRIAEFFDQMRR